MTNALVRAARIVALAIVIGWSLSNLAFHVTDWSLDDMDAYWNAAERLRAGEPLYPPLADASAADVYRYAPWFAWLWVPLTMLPRTMVEVGWSTALLGATVVALLPLRRAGLTGIGVAMLLGSFLVWAASVGNVQPILIAVLVHGLAGRSGPLWIGVAASLKAVPILYALLYVGRREWLRAAAAAIVTGLLVAPMLLTDLRHYPAGSGDAPSPLLAILPVLYVVAVAVGAAVTIRLAAAPSSYARWAAASTVLLALPRITLLDLPHLLVATGDEGRDRHA